MEVPDSFRWVNIGSGAKPRPVYLKGIKLAALAFATVFTTHLDIIDVQYHTRSHLGSQSIGEVVFFLHGWVTLSRGKLTGIAAIFKSHYGV